MLFRVWDKKNNCYSKKSFLLDEDGDLWDDSLVIDYKNYEVEFNTGITLADGTETFFGDIVKWKDKFKLKDNYLRHNKIFFEDGYVYSVIRPSNLFDLTETWLCEGNVWHEDIEFVGNIHETKLTDAMKAWIKE